jgi:DNA-binding PadR family transcriptional regulator
MSRHNQFLESESITPAVFYILLSLTVNKLHGYEIMKKVSENSNSKIKLGPGTLYGAIKRLVEEGLIVEDKDINTERRRYYSITKKGREVLRVELERFSQALKVAKEFKLLPNLNI